jgi:hypothetical protein
MTGSHSGIGDAERDDLLARAVHRLYLEQRLGAGELFGSTPSMSEWESLPEEFKDSSREQARNTAHALERIGYAIRPADTGLGVTALTDDEVEILSQLAHERWTRERLRNGWRYGDARDDDRRVHPDLIPWEQLPSDRRDIDRQLVRQLPRIVAASGQMLVRRIT